jgi:hypothetical protein
VAPVRLLILDADVLIDYCKTDRSILTLVARHVGPVHVAAPIIGEVKQLDEASASDLGLVVIEPPIELAAQAAARRGGRLSFQDRLCLMLAKANGWTCVSNDRQLRLACEAEEVSVLWGLEILALVVDAGGIEPEGAREVAEAIHASNRFITRQVLQRFLRRIGVRTR